MYAINKLFKFVRNKKYFSRIYTHSQCKVKPPWKVIFYGTDEFSVESLKVLCKEYRHGSLLSNLEVVTSPKAKKNPIEVYSQQEKLLVHKYPVDEIKCGNFDIGIVVSFGHLIPANIIKSFNLGMLNVHASLLPRWRGAAPVIYAMANGDQETGITIMKIKPNKFDIGEIVRQVRVKILPDDRLPDLLNRLAQAGAFALVSTLREMPSCLNCAKPQSNEGVTYAPKIDQKMAVVLWDSLSARSVINLDRALTGVYPLMTTFCDTQIKLYNISQSQQLPLINFVRPGLIRYCKQSKSLEIQCSDGNWIMVTHVGVPGRRMMSAADFNNGFLSKVSENFRICR
ncbi:hypothetical protein PPYR_15420 [Photinus pyralis]|uniref:Methionyl-tRNA formyltransferase, mitochondrial n=1 Tax=Photinus pyralis TaxID=7054 RepID=A0A1Y1KIK9_PHOPY|nr:methionyl-tRNA formyltransferase, mitochondrial isoform X2 [Photinus pyralis]KAB0790244.1 hypothetical protein PPYR_15420 [Photinus pyralis]